MKELSKIIPVMMDAATFAGAMLIEKQPEAKIIEQSRKDFLTNTDIMSEKIIIDRLNAAFPEIPVYSEEIGGEALKEGLLFIIDPIDGTVNYFHQDKYYWGISIALAYDGLTEVGLVYFPGRNKRIDIPIVASRIDSATVQQKRKFSVSKQNNISESQVWTDWIKGKPETTLTILGKLRTNTLYPQMRLCATAELVEVATGRIDGYVHPKPEPFDIAAGCLIVEKAGGRVTDIKGEPWTPFSESIVATNGLIHDRLLDILNN